MALQFTFKRGLPFIEGQERWELDRRLPTGKFQFRSESGELLNLSPGEVLRRWQKQEWVVDEEQLDNIGGSYYITTSRDLSTYPLKLQVIATRRLQYLQRLDPERTPYNPATWRERIAVIATELCDTSPPAPSTVAVWWQRYRQTRSVFKLIPWNRPASSHQHKPGYVVFESVLSEVYLTTNKFPKQTVYERVKARITAQNQMQPPELQITCPGRTTIYRWLEALDQDLVDLAREGAEAARMKYRAAIGTIRVRRILERIEMDHTPLDLIIIDLTTGLPLGRPWVTLAIDRFSRMITGFYISLGAPSANAILQCLRRAILPKEELLATFPEVKHPWPAYGIPSLVAVDNGPDLHSSGFEQACMELSIELLFCGSKVSRHKGAIERFIRTMNTGLIHTLPGTTFSNPRERGDYPAEKQACLDMATLTRLLVKWIVDVYNVTPHKGAGGRPLDLWQESAEKTPIFLPASPQQLELVTGLPAKRTLFHYGVELEGLHYNDNHLQMIRRRVGKNVPVDLKYYEDDVGHIHVFDPDQQVYLRVPARDQEYARGLTREMHHKIREHARQRFGDQCSTPELLAARQDIQDSAKAALTHRKMGNRKAGARQFNPNSEDRLSEPPRDPLAQARQPVRTRRQPLPEDLPSGLDDDLPSFVVSRKGETS